MAYNQAIMNLISDDRYIQHMAFDALRQKWSQLNENTKIQFVKNHTVQLPPEVEPYDWTRLDKDMIDVPVSGWRKLRNLLFPTRQVVQGLDNPDKRWQYSVNLLRAFVNAPRYAFWRTAGRLLRRPDWTVKGMERVLNPIATLPPRRPSDTIKLEHFRYVAEIDRRLSRMPWEEQPYRDFYCGYHAATDTLYVWRR